MTTSGVKPYDVWLMWVEFPDHPGAGKVRAVVVTEVGDDSVSGVIVKVTGNINWNEPGDIVLADWQQAGLLKPSLVRCGQRYEFLPGDLYKWFGSLSNSDAAKVADGLELTSDSLPIQAHQIEFISHAVFMANGPIIMAGLFHVRMHSIIGRLQPSKPASPILFHDGITEPSSPSFLGCWKGAGHDSQTTIRSSPFSGRGMLPVRCCGYGSSKRRDRTYGHSIRHANRLVRETQTP